MCTSFIHRGNDTIFAMNYDNYGNNLQLAPYSKNLFLVTANLYGQPRPLFGIRSDGVFANQQFVDECEAGKFRAGFGVINTIDFIENVLLGELSVDKMDEYLSGHEIVSPPDFNIHTMDVNMPDFNIHAMIATVNGDSYIIEPGRGNLKFDKAEKYIAMSNCSVYEAKQNGQYNGFGADRQLKVEQILEAADKKFYIEDAFAVLKAVQLYKFKDYCSTEFSFVYSANENAVYYCYNREFENIQKYQMEVCRDEG